jgi:hypothetical protein
MKTIDEFVAELNAKFPKVETYHECFIYTTGKRFYKVCKSRDGVKPSSSYAFIDKENGDLYRSASWTQPANYIRGNINDPSGLDSCNQYGVKYLK